MRAFYLSPSFFSTVPEVEWDGGGIRESDGGAARRAGGSDTMKHLTRHSWGKLGEQG